MGTRPDVALVAGVGEGLGGAVARRFARAGHPTVLVYWQLHQQPRSAWTFEVDLRPRAERF